MPSRVTKDAERSTPPPPLKLHLCCSRETVSPLVVQNIRRGVDAMCVEWTNGESFTSTFPNRQVYVAIQFPRLCGSPNFTIFFIITNEIWE